MFLLSEKDLILTSYDVMLFISTENSYIAELLFDKIKDLDKKILIIDVNIFKNIIKRFDLNQVPTAILFDQGKEIKRVEGTSLINCNDILC